MTCHRAGHVSGFLPHAPVLLAAADAAAASAASSSRHCARVDRSAVDSSRYRSCSCCSRDASGASPPAASNSWWAAASSWAVCCWPADANPSRVPGPSPSACCIGCCQLSALLTSLCNPRQCATPDPGRGGGAAAQRGAARWAPFTATRIERLLGCAMTNGMRPPAAKATARMHSTALTAPRPHRAARSHHHSAAPPTCSCSQASSIAVSSRAIPPSASNPPAAHISRAASSASAGSPPP